MQEKTPFLPKHTQNTTVKHSDNSLQRLNVRSVVNILGGLWVKEAELVTEMSQRGWS